MPQSSLSQNEAPVDGADSDFLVGQPPIGYQIYEVPETMQTYDLDAAQADQLEALRGELYQTWPGGCSLRWPSCPRRMRHCWRTTCPRRTTQPF